MDELYDEAEWPQNKQTETTELMFLSGVFKKVVGPMSNNLDQLFGTYSPTPQAQYSSTPLEGLKMLADNVQWAAGCDDNRCSQYQSQPVKQAASSSDIVFVCLGTGLKHSLQ